jgi:hypothetical protein
MTYNLPCGKFTRLYDWAVQYQHWVCLFAQGTYTPVICGLRSATAEHCCTTWEMSWTIEELKESPEYSWYLSRMTVHPHSTMIKHYSHVRSYARSPPQLWQSSHLEPDVLVEVHPHRYQLLACAVWACLYAVVRSLLPFLCLSTDRHCRFFYFIK